jgi:drug/metabolite transporter (DMT)-like permease
MGRAVSRRGWVLFAIMCVVWGIPYLLIKVAVGGVGVPVLLPLALRSGQLAALRHTALVYTPAAIHDWPQRLPSGQALAALAALGIVCTACAFIVFLELIKEAGTSRAMVFTYINPVVAVTAGVALLGEPFTATIAASVVLILGGSLLATGPQRSQVS